MSDDINEIQIPRKFNLYAGISEEFKGHGNPVVELVLDPCDTEELHVPLQALNHCCYLG